MLLKQVQITDFLSMKGKLPVDFDKKVTVLLGSNDHGKSNILAALEHLNDHKPITADEVNWDAKGVPTISFIFTLSGDEIKQWKTIVERLLKESEEKAAAKSTQDGDAEGDAKTESVIAKPTVQASQSVVGSPIRKSAAAQKEEPSPAELPAAVLNPAVTTMTLTRTGVGGSLQLEGVDIDDLPEEMREFLENGKPRVELFKVLTGNLQDSATASNITTDEYEFLQGVFFYAGLDPLHSATVFTQDDKTTRALDVASEKLDDNLRRLWGQGTDLHFHLRHKGSEIEFLADDPSITTQVARMSKRSAGVTQFFRVSMILNARRNKYQANSYIYLFDEPGVYLHPQGQRDLLQVFEKLADENQIVYATHSLFLLNQNFPERHRLIYKNKEGTKIDQKPYRQNWKLATDALGVYFASNILFSNRVLLVEGDSDPIYLYELFRQLNRVGVTDADLNMLGIMGFYDYQSLRFLLQVFKKEGQDTSVLVLVDGDASGKAVAQRVTELCRRLTVPIIKLGDGRSIEDYCLFEDQFLHAVKKTLQNACEAEEKLIPKDLEEKIKKSWDEHRAGKEKAEKREKNDKADKEEKKERLTTGRWFNDVAEEIIQDRASKAVLARNYAEFCREMKEGEPDRERVKEAKTICQDIITKLGVPPVRADKIIEIAEQS